MSTASLASLQAKHFQLIICTVHILLPSTRRRKQREEEHLQPQSSTSVVSLYVFKRPMERTRIAGTQVFLDSAFSLDPLAPLLRKPRHAFF